MAVNFFGPVQYAVAGDLVVCVGECKRRGKLKRAGLLALLTAFSGCAVVGEPVRHQAGADTLTINAEVNGRTFTALVFIDGQTIITHRFPPFVNSRDEKTARYHGHDIRSVLKIIKGLGSTQAQVYVYVDGGDAIEFFF